MLEHDAIATTYCDTELLIYKTIHEFVARYGGTFDDLKEHAGLCFVKAYRSYDGRTKFSYWLRWRVWKHLQELYRKRARQNGRMVFRDLKPEDYTGPPPFDWLAFLDNLTEDAKLVVCVALDTPWCSSPDPKAIRGLVREYLRQPAVGWSGARVRQAFSDVGLALAALP